MPLPSTQLERLVQCCLFNRCFRILIVSASFLFMSRDASTPLIDREVDEGVGCVDAAVVLDPQLVKALRAHRQSTRPFVNTQLVKALRTHTQQRTRTSARAHNAFKCPGSESPATLVATRVGSLDSSPIDNLLAPQRSFLWTLPESVATIVNTRTREATEVLCLYLAIRVGRHQDRDQKSRITVRVSSRSRQPIPVVSP